MEQYWKDVRLDDEGNYDYLAEELPRDSVNWSSYSQKCDCCDKYHKLTKVSTHYFYCYDGWDSISYSECWKCYIIGKITSYFRNRKRIDKLRKENRKTHKKIYNMNISKKEKEVLYNLFKK